MSRMLRSLSSGLATIVVPVVLGATAFAQKGGGGFQAFGAPEIDPSIAAAGLTLLLGGTFLLTGRRRDKTQ